MMRRIGWPKKQSVAEGDGEIAGRGLLFCEDGTQWGSEDEPISAGPNGPASRRSDLKPEWQDSGMTATFRVERHGAAYMVEHGHERVVLYVNQAVCGSEMPFDPKRCRENTQHVLPEGRTPLLRAVDKAGSINASTWRTGSLTCGRDAATAPVSQRCSLTKRRHRRAWSGR